MASTFGDYRSGNPTMTGFDAAPTGGETMTIQGTAIKTLILLAILSCTFFYTWQVATKGYSEGFAPDMGGVRPTAIAIPPSVYGMALAGVLGGFVVAMVTIFNKQWSPVLAPIYAGLEGLALGAISAGFEARYPGIVMESVAATFTILFVMGAVYSTGLIKPSRNFVLGLLVCMFGLLAFYLVDLVLMFFGSYVSVVHDNSVGGIIFSVFACGVASLCLIVDFATIQDDAADKAPKYMEWYGAFSLMVTLVWLYFEILRLRAKMKSGD